MKRVLTGSHFISDFYIDYEMQRQLVRPGLTGLAQVNGRNAIGWKECFKYDIEYVNNVSFWLDVKIVLLTIRNVFLHKNINLDKGYQTLKEYFEEKQKEGKENH